MTCLHGCYQAPGMKENPVHLQSQAGSLGHLQQESHESSSNQLCELQSGPDRVACVAQIVSALVEKGEIEDAASKQRIRDVFAALLLDHYIERAPPCTLPRPPPPVFAKTGVWPIAIPLQTKQASVSDSKSTFAAAHPCRISLLSCALLTFPTLQTSPNNSTMKSMRASSHLCADFCCSYVLSSRSVTQGSACELCSRCMQYLGARIPSMK